MPSHLFAPPIETQIARHDPEPGHKSGRPVRFEAAQAPELIMAELFANKEKTIGGAVGFALEEVYDLQDKRGAGLQKLRPSGLGFVGSKPVQKSSDLLIVDKDLPPRARYTMGIAPNI